MKRILGRALIRSTATLAVVLALSGAVAHADSLEQGFVQPPDSAKPRIWWHWMDGNVTRQGITADLEAMKRAGLGGATLFYLNYRIPAGSVKFNSPEYYELVKFAAQEARRLGLQFSIHNCPGWSSSGGPWITPEHAMQLVTSSSLQVSGPRRFKGPLAQPPTKLDFYRDIAVLAYPTPKVQAPGIRNIEAKNGQSGASVLSSPATNTVPGSVVPSGAIVDLTSRLKSNGELEWEVPAGNWTLLRLGYTPSSRTNHPATAPETAGLECDKLSKKALDLHWQGFLQRVLDNLGPLAGKDKALTDVLIDSYEVGGQNWTPGFQEEFQRRRGYDPLRYFPALAGQVVDSSEISERFLWDLRRTIADLFAENYYGHFKELCRQHGLTASIEPYTGPFESLQCGAPADYPMGEFWIDMKPLPAVKLAASVGHIYGQPIIGAESFTAAPDQRHARWLADAYSLKALGDLVFCQGVNRYTFHCFAMQPWTNRWPGMTMGKWGSHFDRNSTWWEQGKAWFGYAARCQYLLQQGRFVADAAYFCGESTPVEMRAGDPALPAGYDYDGINADVLLHQARVRDGQLVLQSGMRYRLLILPPADRAMRPELLRQLRQFVAEGLTLVGAPPQSSPSLENYPQCDAEVRKLVAELWGNCDGQQLTEHVLGKGKVIWGQPLEPILASRQLQPDFSYDSSRKAKLVYLHRRDGAPDSNRASDIFFVANQRQRFDAVECSFRVSGKVPELWNAQTGEMQPAPVWREEPGRTIVPLNFEPAGSVFVVFRAKARGDHLVSVQSEGPVRAPEPARIPDLRVSKAVYGAFPDGTNANLKAPRTVDVTAKVADQVRDDELHVWANDRLGGNPAGQLAKELRVEYSLDGVVRKTSARQDQMVVLPETELPLGAAPLYRIELGANGQPRIWSAAAGQFTLTTAAGRQTQCRCDAVPAPVEVTGAWNVSFPPGWKAPAEVTFARLESWTQNRDAGIKYFSGTATYRKELEIPGELIGVGRELWLDLGTVKNFAEVSLNGKPLGILWKPPFRVQVTGAARPGRNALEIKVTNLWPNRLIGDEQLPPDCEWDGKQLKQWPQWLLEGKPSPSGRLTFTTWHHWTASEPLLESGLLGPVVLQVWSSVSPK